MRDRTFAAALLSILLGACAGSPPRTPPSSHGDMALLITRLGDDTLAVERVLRDDSHIEATVMLRSPQTTLRTYAILFDVGMTWMLQVEDFDPATGRSRGVTTQSLAAGSGIPFIDMVHWPFVLMLERAIAAGPDTISLPLVAGERTVAFRMERLSDGSIAATHPTRGTMIIEVNDAGRLQSLDASRTTRALRVTREPDADLAAIAASFANRPIAELSGRGEVSVTVAGAEIDVDYGVPLKRGREIFGALVPWDRVWRTGANRATHFSTTRALRFGTALIPAGSYTLFTIPRPDRWTLIVNRNVDINGQQYDQAADLARLDLAVRALDQTVEPFTIVVEPDGAGGVLRLQWDRTEAWLPFAVE